MRKVSIINFKGGVGKTTLSLHLACYLARDNRVLLVDVDHQSSLSLVVLGTENWGAQVSAQKTVNRLFEAFCNPHVELPTEEIIIENPFLARGGWNDFYPNLDFVASQFELDDTEIDLASTNYGSLYLSEWDKRTLLAKWLDLIGARKKYDYVLFDCPPATKIVSQNALASSNCFVIPVIPDELSSRGVTHFQGLVKRKIDEKLKYLKKNANVGRDLIPKNYVSKTQMAAIVPYLVKTAGGAASGYTNLHTEQLADLRKQWGGAVLKTVGKHYIGIPEAVNSGWPIWNFGGYNARPNVKSMMTKMCSELKTRIDAS